MKVFSIPAGFSRSAWFFLGSLVLADLIFVFKIHAGFNRYFLHAVLVLFPVSIFVWWLVASSIAGNGPYCFDPKHRGIDSLKEEGGDFEHHSQRYQDVAKLLITLSTGVIAFLINTLANAKEPFNPIISKIEWSAPLIVGFFGFSIASLVLFMVTQTIWYEEYCHAPKHDTYERLKYRLCNFLGYDGLMAFIIGILWLAYNLFRQ